MPRPDGHDRRVTVAFTVASLLLFLAELCPLS